ncbi:unnamed protein product [Rotaria magnacalcarata]|nr:unnamed protein product [Rotaria magnacalcarata]CAF3785028.1 unnamed protein product [Rotaria magnacalcarata]CAF3806324.1 unnamed protein product [Rotaria magnacalcarata]CAF3835588.1 unnamed protein product [Rotaria magnacalcarata]CAF3881329.1 unnamed protein product [Rotaria magnacalcarata]
MNILLLILINCIFPYVLSLAEEKLQVMTTKKIANCNRRSKVGDTLYMQYTGILKSNGQKFDSSYDRGHPFVFKIGFQQAIKGWDQGLLNICEGEERKLIIPPSYAYGDVGAGDVIPPGATLLMDVLCEKIENDSNSFTWPLDDFNDDKLQEKINDFPVYDYKDDNVDMCKVEIFIDYTSRLLIISFGDSFEWKQLDHGEGRLDLLIMFNESNTDADIYHVLEYSCYDRNKCNELFVFNHIHWLRQANYTSFQTNLRSILFNNSDKTESCFNDKVHLLNCSSNVCSGKYSTYHKNYFFQCHQNSKASVEVHIITNMIVIEENYSNDIYIGEYRIISYTCKFNQCNNQFLTDKLIDIVEKEYQLLSMKKILLESYSLNTIETTYSNMFDFTYKMKSTTAKNKFSPSKTYFFHNHAKTNSYLSHFIHFIVFIYFI